MLLRDYACAAVLFLGVPAIAFSASADRPAVSLVFTHDGSAPPQMVRRAERILAAAVAREDRWRLAESGMIPTREMIQASSRRALIDRGRRTRADYAADIRLVKLQTASGRPWALAYAWTVDTDSAAYAVATEATWIPEDSIAFARNIELLLDRLVPTNGSVCYAELRNNRVARRGDLLDSAVVDVSVLDDRRRPAAADVTGYWRVNGRPTGERRLRTDPTGTATARWSADGGEFVNAEFVLTNVACDSAAWDQQWQQREVDRAVALLENARADLDEDAAYERAIARAEQFLAIGADDLSWFDVLLYPPDAPDRRQQALSLIRRARRNTIGREIVHPADGDTWAINTWFGYDLVTPSRDGPIAAATGCDTCGGLRLMTAEDRRVEFGAMVRRKVIRSVWLSAGGALAFGQRLLWAIPGRTARNNIRTTTLASSFWFPYELTSSSAAYVEIGARLTRLSEDVGFPYWKNSSPFADPPPPLPYFRLSRPDAAFHPGAFVTAGAAAQMSDWSPAWLNAEISAAYDRRPDEESTWRLTFRLGFALRR